MNVFYIYHYTGGKFVELEGSAVFPINFSDMLDETLDEMYVTVYNSPISNFKTTDVFKIKFHENHENKYLMDYQYDEHTLAKTTYFVLADDRAFEYPVGSGKYKHDLFLIEPTKLLEGIVCQSLTFTNVMGRGYDVNKQTAIPDITGDEYENTDDLVKWCEDKFKTPQEMGGTYEFPNLLSLVRILTGRQDGFVKGDDWYCRVTTPSLDIIEYDPLSEKYISVAFEESGVYMIDYSYNNSSLTGSACTVTFYIASLHNTYDSKPWSVTDMTCRVLELAEPLFLSDSQPRILFDGMQYENGFKQAPKITGGQAEKYDKVFGSELVLTQSTLREQLKEIGNLISAEPRLVISEGPDGNLVYTVRYDEYGSQETVRLPANYTSKQLNRSINEYCTELRAYASNIVNTLDHDDGVICDPAAGAFKTLRTDVVNVRVTEENGYAATAFPIYEIKKVECSIYGNNSIGSIDITPYVLEKSEYITKGGFADDPFPIGKQYFLYYSQGAPNISGLFYTGKTTSYEEAWLDLAIVNILSLAGNKTPQQIAGTAYADFKASQIAFRISYIPIYPALIAHSNQKYEDGDKGYSRIYSQGANLLEASFFGNHLKGTAARLGNVSEERTYVLKSITDIPRVGDRTEDGYCIAAVNTSFMPTLTKCTLALSKDFNRISQYVGINSSKRTYEISEKETYKRDVLIREKIVFGRTYRPSAENTIGKHSKNLVKVLDKKSFQPLTVVNVETYNFQGKRLAGATLPLVSSAFGNSLTFTWRHIDNYSSGTTALQMSKGNVEGSYVFDVPYADYYGRVYSYGFLLANGYSIDNTVDQALVAHAFPKYVKANDNYALSIGTSDASRYLMRKDSREHISSFTLQFEYQSEDEDLIIGNALAAKNSLISNCDQAIKLYLFGEGVKIGRFQTHIRDIKDKVIETNENFDIIDVAGPTCKLHFTGQLTQDVCCWAIATVITSATHTYEDDYGNVSEVTTDTGGEILLACNTPELKGELLHPEIFISIQK